ncbi:hypothetical protein ACJX0J_040376, partial [Zea mays]
GLQALTCSSIKTDRGDFCASAGAREAVSILEKVDCEHANVVVQPGFSLSANDIRNPSAEAATLSGNVVDCASFRLFTCITLLLRLAVPFLLLIVSQ